MCSRIGTEHRMSRNQIQVLKLMRQPLYHLSCLPSPCVDNLDHLQVPFYSKSWRFYHEWLSSHGFPYANLYDFLFKSTGYIDSPHRIWFSLFLLPSPFTVVCLQAHVCHGIGQRTDNVWESISPSTIWVTGIKLRSSGKATNAILPAPTLYSPNSLKIHPLRVYNLCFSVCTRFWGTTVHRPRELCTQQ